MTTLDRFSLTGRVALVTGAVGLLGQRHCHALASAGASVLVADIDAAKAAEVAAALPTGEGVSHRGVGLDVTSKPSVEAARQAVLDHYGRLDVLVNNAAINDRFEQPELAAELSRFEVYPVESFRASLDVNVTGVFLCAQVLGSLMAEAGQGSIINIASTYGVVGPDQRLYLDEKGNQPFYKSAVYPATKGAVISFTRFLAAYWGHRGVRVNTLSPGGVENGQDHWFQQQYAQRTLLGRMAQPDDYEGALLFLASDASAYMTGTNLLVDGGWTAV